MIIFHSIWFVAVEIIENSYYLDICGGEVLFPFHL